VATFTLIAHPDRCPTVSGSLQVAVARGAGAVMLRYEVFGLDEVKWPAPAIASRADELWRSTCFELFLMFDDGERYVEFNFSPSGRWAAYAFDGYRDGMAVLDVRRSPVVTRVPAGVDVVCPLGDLPHGEHRMGLSAVIEEIDGTKSYWALAHATGPPDFHNPACFIATLPSPDAA
jgi:hypothetical protein